MIRVPTSIKRFPETAFLAALFRRLNASGINYFVLRNYAELPFSLGGSDLDLYIEPTRGHCVWSEIQSALSECGGVQLGRARISGLTKVTAFGRCPDTAQWWGVTIDVFSSLEFRGHRFACADRVPVKTHNGIRVLRDDFADLLAVVKDIVHHGAPSSRYAAGARAALQTSDSDVLLAPLGPLAISLLRTHLTGDAELLVQRAFLKHVRRASLQRYVQDELRYLNSRATRYLRPSGIVIAILGVDGAGKSTLIGEIQPILESATHGAVRVRHLRPTFLPAPARLVRGGAPEPRVNTNPHSKPSSGVLVSMLRLSYLLLDYWVGYLLKVRTFVAKQPSAFIFDRYAFDLVIDPRRFRISLPRQVLRTVARIVPVPDLTCLLVGTPSLIAARKAELSEEEISRQMQIMTELAATIPNATTVSVDASVQDARDQILNSLFLRCLARTRQ